MNIFNKINKTELISFRTYKSTSNHIDELCERLGGSRSDVISFAVHLTARHTDSQLLRKAQLIVQEDLKEAMMNSSEKGDE